MSAKLTDEECGQKPEITYFFQTSSCVSAFAIPLPPLRGTLSPGEGKRTHSFCIMHYAFCILNSPLSLRAGKAGVAISILNSSVIPSEAEGSWHHHNAQIPPRAALGRNDKKFSILNSPPSLRAGKAGVAISILNSQFSIVSQLSAPFPHTGFHFPPPPSPE